MNEARIVGLDFETYSAAPLPSVGLKNYVMDETFTPTLAAMAAGGVTLSWNMVDPTDRKDFISVISDPYWFVVAHNAGFERAVLRHLGLDIPVFDSAVVAACAGANRHLRGAAEQLLDKGKLDEDGRLLRLFAMPQQDQEDLHFDESLIESHLDEWQMFVEYCKRDAELSRQIFIDHQSKFQAVHDREMAYAQVTLAMNERGWPVAIDEAVRMLEIYRENLDEIQWEFANNVDPDLNLASTPQLKEWCEKRGVRSSSFDKEHVDKLIARLEKRAKRTAGQNQVLHMLRTKRELGGSSVKKLETIIDTAYEGRVYDQYVHAGAGQSLRTSGRSIQMQNLPRLSELRDMSSLFTKPSAWDNQDLSENLRQLFRAEAPGGELVVADYSAIESRALAWLANEDWKMDAYRQGVGIYEMQASKHYGIPVDQITKDQRMFGKVGELSCGYGAGPVAVRDFAAKMGVELSELEAGELVRGWRKTNVATVRFWDSLQDALVSVVAGTADTATVPVGPESQYFIWIGLRETPQSLQKIDPNAKSITLLLWKWGSKAPIMERLFHGCYMDGNNVGYYKPSSLKGGKPWVRTFTNPKTKQQQRHNLYGGKLAGIITQSLCREIFFDGLLRLEEKLLDHSNATLIGQFHDEVIIEWSDPDHNDGLLDTIRDVMSGTPVIIGLPMAVEVKYAHRYIK